MITIEQLTNLANAMTSDASVLALLNFVIWQWAGVNCISSICSVRGTMPPPR